MPKSYVLRALKLLSLEEILKLTTAVKLKTGLLKKAAGQELVSWESETVEKAPPQEASADILPFTRPRTIESNTKDTSSSQASSGM